MARPDLGIVHNLERSMRIHRSRTALVAGDIHWTYARLDAESARVAHALDGLGITPGRRVLIALGNRAEYLAAFVGCLRAGVLAVPVNQMLSAGDVGRIADHAKPDLALVAAENLHQIDGLDLPTVVCGDGPISARSWAELVAGLPEHRDPSTRSADEPVVLLYTGGTTGAPKGVVHTGLSLGMNAWSQLLEGEIRRDERLVLSTPLSHAAGFFLLPALCRGATGIILSRFDPDEVARVVVEQGGSWTYMVPSMLYRWLDAGVPERYDLTNLRTIVYGAAAVMGSRLADAVTRHPGGFIQQYGQTEVPTFATVLSKEDHRAALAADAPREFESAGYACAMCEVAVVDPTGTPLPTGESGEIALRSPYTMTGYLDAPEATAAAFFGEWLRTGDIGRMESDSRLYLLDRIKDMVITGGMNVYTREVEEEIQRFDCVRHVACFGVPDERWGERLEAAVVLHDDAPDPDPEALRLLFGGALTSYKRPKTVHVLPALPTTPFGKFDKKALRGMVTKAGQE